MGLLVKVLLVAWALFWIASQALGLVERCGGRIGETAGATLARWRRAGKIVGRVILVALAVAVAHTIAMRFLNGSGD